MRVRVCVHSTLGFPIQPSSLAILLACSHARSLRLTFSMFLTDFTLLSISLRVAEATGVVENALAEPATAERATTVLDAAASMVGGWVMWVMWC